jgi:hypothetical protein
LKYDKNIYFTAREPRSSKENCVSPTPGLNSMAPKPYQLICLDELRGNLNFGQQCNAMTTFRNKYKDDGAELSSIRARHGPPLLAPQAAN